MKGLNNMKNYICIDGNKTELTNEQLQQLGIKLDTSVSEFVELFRGNDFRAKYDVGDTVELCGDEYIIIGFDHDDENSVTLMKKVLLPPACMHDEYNCEHGWQGAKLRKWLNEEYIKTMPPELVNAIQPVVKVSHNYRGEKYTTEDKLFILSESELFGSAIYSRKEDGDRYELFATSADRVMCDEDGDSCWYWTRSAGGGASAGFCLVSRHGDAYSHSASSAHRVPLCFTIA